MEKDIATLNVQLKAKEDNFDELDDEIIHQVRKEEKSVILCYARAIMDFNPNGLRFFLPFFHLFLSAHHKSCEQRTTTRPWDS